MYIKENLFYIVDILVVLIYLYCIFRAYKNGLLYELFNTICLFGTIIISWILAPVLANRMMLLELAELNNPLIDFSNIKILVNTIVWFFICFVIISILVMVIKPIFKSFTKVPIIGGLNRLFGAVFGVINATVLTILLSLLLSMPFFKNGKDVVDNSFLTYVKEGSNLVLKIALDTLDIDQIKIEGFDIDKARDEVSKWIDSTGIFNNDQL